MAKGAPRNATASQVILRQAEQPEPEPVQVKIVKVDPEEAERKFAVRGGYNDGTPTAYQPKTIAMRAKRGVKAGLREGETRITCILRDEQSQVLHDWAKLTGRTFREVTLAMADRYIEEVIRPATSGNRKLNNTGTVPEAYADLYGDIQDQWAQYFE